MLSFQKTRPDASVCICVLPSPESTTGKQDEIKAKGDDSIIPASDLDSKPSASCTDGTKLKEENLALTRECQGLEKENVELEAALVPLVEKRLLKERDRKKSLPDADQTVLKEDDAQKVGVQQLSLSRLRPLRSSRICPLPSC